MPALLAKRISNPAHSLSKSGERGTKNNTAEYGRSLLLFSLFRHQVNLGCQVPTIRLAALPK